MDDARRSPRDRPAASDPGPSHDPDWLGWELEPVGATTRHAERLVLGGGVRTRHPPSEAAQPAPAGPVAARRSPVSGARLTWQRLLRGLERGDAFLFDADARRNLARIAAAYGVHLCVRPADAPSATRGSEVDRQPSAWFRVTAYTGVTAADG